MAGAEGESDVTRTVWPFASTSNKNRFQNEKSGRFNVRQQMRQQAMERNAS